MSFTIVQQLLDARLASIWGNTDTVQWDNITPLERLLPTFIRPWLSEIDSKPLGLGCSRDYYLYTIQIFVKTEIGTLDINGLSDAIIDGFRNFASGHLICNKAWSERIGEDREHFQRNVYVNLQYDKLS